VATDATLTRKNHSARTRDAKPWGAGVSGADARRSFDVTRASLSGRIRAKPSADERTRLQGLYGVHINDSDGSIAVIEVNDNPNLERGVEDLIGKDEVSTRILKWFVKRIDAPGAQARRLLEKIANTGHLDRRRCRRPANAGKGFPAPRIQHFALEV
jgi:hypothetical protein